MNYYDSNDEKVDMFLMYGMGYLCRKNAMVAADLYLQRYPNRRHIFIYLHFLQNELPLLLEELDLNTRPRQQRMWLQQDGASSHFHRNVRQNLDDNFTNICIE
jgi:hypothetical protein